MMTNGRSPLSISVRRHDEEAVINLGGELDISNGSDLAAALAPLLQMSAATTIVFDLVELEFMDSSGLAVMLSAVAEGKRVRLRSPSKVIRQIIGATGLTGVLAVES